MTLTLRPRYIGSPCSSVDELANTLGITTNRLNIVAQRSDSSFRLHKRIIKPDMTTRDIYDLNPELKHIHRLIVRNYLKKCQFPDYLTGSLKGCDYVANANFHTNSGTVIRIDASNFFPSISALHVNVIWTKIFGFSDEVSRLLTEISTRQGALAQGAPVSSYLANLVPFDIEPVIVKDIRKEGLRYTRYVGVIVKSGV